MKIVPILIKPYHL